ncbi:hypothetical protein [Spirosoma agri]|uniref:Uncharacterized protein n=1 Tax=Spirosoma agri TaxID=1987381 RepID=A0A6M0IJD4_9BACT|nr:hypothetical protein [Spirosoma agri]NEU68324.1 hypothetical protein [Spirosoma agri]
MASIQVEIESYTVTAYRDISTRYEIKLISKALQHGIRYNARLIFEGTDAKDKGYIQNVDGLNFDPRNAVVNYDLADFTGIYQILSTESPVFFFIAYEDKVSSSPPNSHRLIQTQLKTNAEIPGDFEKK